MLRKCRVKIQKKELFLSTSSTDKEGIEVVVREIIRPTTTTAAKRQLTCFSNLQNRLKKTGNRIWKKSWGWELNFSREKLKVQFDKERER
jgi:hypothetical protein